ncbi:hypothetical protein D9758_013203 [Tetrapyrgos nigripes]|uniref:Uncharacterized protein n=1 Tax=Tetrapyrgos nigripes TaxID=182062 RepID=A0A8H5CRQ7_9AGAR|nr:hypothetical protein D9758_013203 [Tetrapyrgos nigripes]
MSLPPDPVVTAPTKVSYDRTKLPASPDPEPKDSEDPTPVYPLSEHQLNRAKDLILDLLGWGVSPEYLVHVGVSSHTIHRVFTDLNLRLPTNLRLESEKVVAVKIKEGSIDIVPRGEEKALRF